MVLKLELATRVVAGGGAAITGGRRPVPKGKVRKRKDRKKKGVPRANGTNATTYPPPPPPPVQKELCAAIAKDDVAMVHKLLAEGGADPSVCGSDDPLRPPVYLAAKYGFLKVVRALLEHNGDPNQAKADNGYTSVSIAATHGHVEILTLLLEHKADVNQAAT